MSNNYISPVVESVFKDRTQEEKDNIKQYIIAENQQRDENGRYAYEETEGYKFAEAFIDALTYDDEHMGEWTGKYQGCRKFCGDCKYWKYKSKYIKNDDGESKTQIISNCKMIDHNKVKLCVPYFQAYDCGQHGGSICCHFEPAEWNLTAQRDWTGIEDYIEFLDKYFYAPSVFEKRDGISKLDIRTVALVYDGNIYNVTLRNWLEGTAVKDGKINYKNWYECKGRKRILHNENGSIEIRED
jgi:hypothetical protein